MRWKGQRESQNVEDRRGKSNNPFGQIFGGNNRIRRMPIRGKRGGGLIMLIIIVIAGFYGIDLTTLLGGGGLMPTNSNSTQTVNSAEENEALQFTSVVLASTEDTWGKIFSDAGRNYVPPKLVVYTNSTITRCGHGQAAMGPFYCPADQTVYIDLSFYNEMKQKLGGGGDFAQGYVIAHEVGHHVQNLLGTSSQVQMEQSRSNKKEANKLSVLLELQADCYAGIWGKSIDEQNWLENGDLETAIKTAQAIGDDQLQKKATGRVMPDSFTHGTSEQREYWFKQGLNANSVDQCNTFATDI